MNLATSLDHPVFRRIGAVADRLGLDTYVVGGYVRDLILKRPSKDIDFVCIGSGIALAQEVARALGPDVHVAIYKNFGTAQIRFDNMDLEFVGARKESYRAES